MDHNADAPWSNFDPEAYVDSNYRIPLKVDMMIVQLMRDHFRDCFDGGIPSGVTGVDMGAGANLYPALSMLPWCEKLTLLEYAGPNVLYLEKQKLVPGGYDKIWDAFWDELTKVPVYRDVTDPRARFTEIVQVERANLFDLDGARRWGLGTMFFVADSMSESENEFRLGVRCFARSLAEGAPYAAAFMKDSAGYDVGEYRFPAYRVKTKDQVAEILKPFSTDLKLHDLHHVVRPGHEGMILALGRRNSEIAVPR
jgi:hypothetical protein